MRNFGAGFYAIGVSSMGFFFARRSWVLAGLALWVMLSPLGQCQTETKAQEQEKEGPPEFKGMPARMAATDYQVQGHAGSITIAADFDGHAVVTQEGNYSSEDYVVVEVALFGPAGTHLKVSAENFSLKINDKKSAYPSQPFEYLTRSLKDPDWQPPDQDQEKKSKTGINTGGGGDNGPPTVPKMPLPLRRTMEQKVLKSVLPEGDRELPVDGLIFFNYRGKTQNIKQMELVYNGPAGNVGIPMQP
jgi:hypothetical protein